jgi:hypothetical protein
VLWKKEVSFITRMILIVVVNDFIGGYGRGGYYGGSDYPGADRYPDSAVRPGADR